MYFTCFHKNAILTFSLFLTVLFTGCGYKPNNIVLQKQSRSDYELFLLVNARHLDYSSGKALLKTLVKHPSDGSKNCDVGHAWIFMRGILKGENITIEGGHSGELGSNQPRYFDGIMRKLEQGDPNPVSSLWEAQADGFFQRRSGGHRPTYAIKINLTEEQFLSILSYIDPKHYDYANYSLVGNQCASFVVNVAKIAGLDLDNEVTINIPQNLDLKTETLHLWDDPIYSQLNLCTPDTLEQQMMHAVEDGYAEYALPLYLQVRKPRRCPGCRLWVFCETVSRFPERYKRACFFR